MADTIIIMNEREWCEETLRNLKPGKRPGETLMRLARYYYSLGCSRKEIIRQLEDFIIRCNPRDSLFSWHKTVEKCAQRAGKRDLIEVESVSITQAELDTIKQVGGKIKQRLLFTLLCLAKFSNAVNPQNHDWVNYAIRDVFSLANIKIGYKNQLLMLNELLTAGLMQLSKSLESTSLKLTWVDHDGGSVLEITDLRNIGNQYMKYIGEDYIECEICGLIVRRHSNRQIYCAECAAIENRTKTANGYHASVLKESG